MKNMKEGRIPAWTREIEAPYLFYELAHGIARAFMVSLTSSCPEGLKYHPIVKLDSLITSATASASCGCNVNGHGVRGGADGPGVIDHRKPNGV